VVAVWAAWVVWAAWTCNAALNQLLADPKLKGRSVKTLRLFLLLLLDAYAGQTQ
jgi:hypothetical protein